MVKMKTRKRTITLKRLDVLWAVVEYQEFMFGMLCFNINSKCLQAREEKRLKVESNEK